MIKARTCEYCNSKLLSKEDLDRHLDRLNGSCPKQPVECIFKSIGCNITDHFNNIDTIDDVDQMEVAAANNMHNINNENIIRRENLNEHMLLNTNYHLELIHRYYYCELEELKEKLNDFNDSNKIELLDDKCRFNKPESRDFIDNINSSDSKIINNIKNLQNFDDSRFQLDDVNKTKIKKI